MQSIQARLVVRLGWLAALAFLSACHSGRPRIPDGWVAVPGPSIEAKQNRDDHARLQVIICYGRWLSNHSTVRLTSPDGHVLFWDPGGMYGRKDASIRRRADLLLSGAPDLGRWWHYREHGCGEPFMKVFEWSVSSDQAKSLRDALIAGSRPPAVPGAFQTATAGGFCCIAVSEFLQRFGGPSIVVPTRMFWPHNLADHLWSQSPDRVVVFEAGGAVVAYVHEDGV